MNEPAIDPGDLAEEQVRAEWYGLLARLFYQAPDAAWHQQLGAARRSAHDPAVELDVAWHALLTAAEQCSTEELEAEYDALFGGIGKPDVYLFGSHYLSGFLNEKPLVQLRDDLRAFGVARADSVLDTEDHIACLFDAMRHLIIEVGDGQQEQADIRMADPPDAAEVALERQRMLFERHIASWTDQLAAALLRHPKARFYARLADLLVVFVAIERQAFEMMEAHGGSSA